MDRFRVQRLAILVVALLGLCLLSPFARGVTAAPGAALLVASPAAATAGATVTLLGAGFTPATSDLTPTVTVAFTDAAGTRTTLPQTTTTTTTGSFSLAVVVPSASATGPAEFSATDISGAVATATFEVRPAATGLTATPNSGVPGATSTIIGTGFAVNQPVTLTFTQGANVTILAAGTITTTNVGQFSAAIVIPGNATAGAASIVAQDRDGNSVGTPFTVVRTGAPSLGIAPSAVVRPSTPVTVTGVNFAAGQPVTVTFSQVFFPVGGIVTDVLVSGTVTTDSMGTFTATAVIPSAAMGSATLSAIDPAGNSAGLPLTIVTAAPTLTVTPTDSAPTSPLTVTGAGFVAGEPVTVTFSQGGATSQLASGTTDGTGAFTATATIPSTALTGTATISATDGVGNTAGATVRVTFPLPATSGPTTLYFAEGYTGLATSNNAADFDETLAILNANPITATVTIQYLIQGAKPMMVTRLLAPHTVLRESVKKDVGVDRTVAVVVSSSVHITAERIMNRVDTNGAILGTSTSLGSPNLGTTFYFPAGAAGPDYMEYLSLVNPGSQDAHVSIAYATDFVTSTGTLSTTLVVPANGRATHRVGNDSGGDTFAAGSGVDMQVGMIVTSDQPIMAERVLYFGAGDGSGKFGSTTQAGIMTAGNQYLFAYGSAGGTGLAQRFDDHSAVAVLNPGVSPMAATVVAQFIDAAGQVLGTTSVAVNPGTRQTIDADAVISDTSRVYSTLLTSSSPFAAEETQYVGGLPNAGAHPGFALQGAPAGVTNIAFPDLSLVNGSGAQLQQTVFLYNPTSSPITVTATYYSDRSSLSDRGSLAVDYGVAPGSITTVDVNADAAALHAQVLGGTFVVTSGGAQDSFVATNVANSVDGRIYTGTQGSLAAL